MLKTNGLNNLKSEVNKLDIDQLKKILRDVVDNDVIKKIVYDELVKNVNAIDTSRFIKKTDYNPKIEDVENKLTSIAGVVITTAFTVVENKVPNVSGLVRKRYCEAKIKVIDKKYFTTLDYNKFNSSIFDAKITK